MKKYLVLILILCCCSPGFKKADLNNPNINDYMFFYFTGIMMNLEAACKITSIEYDGKLVSISGKVYDKLTLETFPNTVWVGKYIEESDSVGGKYFAPFKEDTLMLTGDDGIFRVKFKLKKDDCLIVGTMCYDPVVIRIYDYVNDFY